MEHSYPGKVHEKPNMIEYSLENLPSHVKYLMMIFINGTYLSKR